MNPQSATPGETLDGKPSTENAAESRSDMMPLDPQTQRDILGKEHRRLRLLIAIPALMVLTSLTAGIISYEIICDMADSSDLANVKTRLESVADSVRLANFIASFIALFFGVGLAIYITRPIRAMTQGAKRFASGDLSANIHITTPDELGELGESFNSLVVHLNRVFEERNRYILEGFFEGLVTIGNSGEIMSVNSQAVKIFGCETEDLIGVKPARVLDDIPENKGIKAHLETLQYGLTRTTIDKVSFRNKSGDNRVISLTANPILDQKGNWKGCILIMRDLAVLATFTEQIQKADRLAAIGSFATGIAHELRNPLGSIKGIAQLLAENPDPARIQEYSGLIVGEVDRLDRVIRTLLDFSHPEPEGAEPSDVVQIVRKALDHASNNPTVKDQLDAIEIREEFSSVPPCLFQPGRVVQALSNIILNALQIVDGKGSISLCARLVQKTDVEPMVEIAIIDDGPPIPRENLEKIFEPFFTTSSYGTGLGLPIAYQIIVSNGGTVSVQSAEDKTAFLVSFPAFFSEGYPAQATLSQIYRDINPSKSGES